MQVHNRHAYKIGCHDTFYTAKASTVHDAQLSLLLIAASGMAHQHAELQNNNWSSTEGLDMYVH